MADATAFLVEYEVIESWEIYPESGNAKTPVWQQRRALVFTQEEADSVASNNRYCRHKRVTALAPIVGVQAGSPAADPQRNEGAK